MPILSPLVGTAWSYVNLTIHHVLGLMERVSIQKNVESG